MADFITASRQAKYDADTKDLEELRNWHKKTGSNLLLAAAILSGGGRSGAADGRGLPLARLENRSRLTRPVSASVVGRRRKSRNFKMAEREGFEPPVLLSEYTRSPGVPDQPLWHLSVDGKLFGEWIHKPRKFLKSKGG
jgi:hypothetical protein